MFGFRWFFTLMLLLSPCGAFCADHGGRKSGGASAPEGATIKDDLILLPRRTDTRATIEKPAAPEAEGGAKPAERSPKEPEEAAPVESQTTPAEDSAKDEATIPDDRRDDLKAAGEIPDDLGDALSLALSRNPLLRVAEAKVRAAQAEYDQVSLSVVHDVTLAFREYKKQKDRVVAKEFKRLHAEDLERAKAKLMYVLGIETRLEARWAKVELIHEPVKTLLTLKVARQPESPPRNASEQPMSDELRAALQTPIDADFEDTPLSDVLDFMAESVGQKSGGIRFVKKEKILDVPVSLTLQKVSVRAALQAIADLTETSFVFRDYGILVLPVAGDAKKYRLIHAPMIAPAPDPALQTFPLPPAE